MNNAEQADIAELDMIAERGLDTSGLGEEYWTQRNALVDAVRAAAPQWPNGVGNLPSVGGEGYEAAIKALADFDLAHGGTPIL
jgi:hypothetical protein